jgi:hypothetical protein
MTSKKDIDQFFRETPIALIGASEREAFDAEPVGAGPRKLVERA